MRNINGSAEAEPLAFTAISDIAKQFAVQDIPGLSAQDLEIRLVTAISPDLGIEGANTIMNWMSASGELRAQNFRNINIESMPISDAIKFAASPDPIDWLTHIASQFKQPGVAPTLKAVAERAQTVSEARKAQEERNTIVARTASGFQRFIYSANQFIGRLIASPKNNSTNITIGEVKQIAGEMRISETSALALVSRLTAPQAAVQATFGRMAIFGRGVDRLTVGQVIAIANSKKPGEALGIVMGMGPTGKRPTRFADALVAQNRIAPDSAAYRFMQNVELGANLMDMTGKTATELEEMGKDPSDKDSKGLISKEVADVLRDRAPAGALSRALANASNYFAADWQNTRPIAKIALPLATAGLIVTAAPLAGFAIGIKAALSVFAFVGSPFLRSYMNNLKGSLAKKEKETAKVTKAGLKTSGAVLSIASAFTSPMVTALNIIGIVTGSCMPSLAGISYGVISGAYSTAKTNKEALSLWNNAAQTETVRVESALDELREGARLPGKTALHPSAVRIQELAEKHGTTPAAMYREMMFDGEQVSELKAKVMAAIAGQLTSGLKARAMPGHLYGAAGEVKDSNDNAQVLAAAQNLAAKFAAHDLVEGAKLAAEGGQTKPITWPQVEKAVNDYGTTLELIFQNMQFGSEEITPEIAKKMVEIGPEAAAMARMLNKPLSIGALDLMARAKLGISTPAAPKAPEAPTAPAGTPSAPTETETTPGLKGTEEEVVVAPEAQPKLVETGEGPPVATLERPEAPAVEAETPLVEAGARTPRERAQDKALDKITDSVVAMLKPGPINEQNIRVYLKTTWNIHDKDIQDNIIEKIKARLAVRETTKQAVGTSAAEKRRALGEKLKTEGPKKLRENWRKQLEERVAEANKAIADLKREQADALMEAIRQNRADILLIINNRIESLRNAYDEWRNENKPSGWDKIASWVKGSRRVYDFNTISGHLRYQIEYLLEIRDFVSSGKELDLARPTSSRDITIAAERLCSILYDLGRESDSAGIEERRLAGHGSLSSSEMARITQLKTVDEIINKIVRSYNPATITAIGEIGARIGEIDREYDIKLEKAEKGVKAIRTQQAAKPALPAVEAPAPKAFGIIPLFGLGGLGTLDSTIGNAAGTFGLANLMSIAKAGLAIAAFLGGIILIQKAFSYFAARRETARLAASQAQLPVARSAANAFDRLWQHRAAEIGIDLNRLPPEGREKAVKAIMQAMRGEVPEAGVKIIENSDGTLQVETSTISEDKESGLPSVTRTFVDGERVVASFHTHPEPLRKISEVAGDAIASKEIEAICHAKVPEYILQFSDNGIITSKLEEAKDKEGEFVVTNMNNNTEFGRIRLADTRLFNANTAANEERIVMTDTHAIAGDGLIKVEIIREVVKGTSSITTTPLTPLVSRPISVEKLQNILPVPLPAIMQGIATSALAPKKTTPGYGMLAQDLNTEGRTRAVAQRIRDMKNHGMIAGAVAIAPHIDMIADKDGRISSSDFDRVIGMAKNNRDVIRVAILIDSEKDRGRAETIAGPRGIEVINIGSRSNGQTITEYVRAEMSNRNKDINIDSNKIGIGLMMKDEHTIGMVESEFKKNGKDTACILLVDKEMQAKTQATYLDLVNVIAGATTKGTSFLGLVSDKNVNAVNALINRLHDIAGFIGKCISVVGKVKEWVESVNAVSVAA